MEDTFLKIRETINKVERRPNLWLYRNSPELPYESIANFWVGYFSGIEINSKMNIESELNSWIQLKRKIPTSLHWTGYIYLILAKKDDKKACKIIYKILKEFFDFHEAKVKEEKKIE